MCSGMRISRCMPQKTAGETRWSTTITWPSRKHRRDPASLPVQDLPHFPRQCARTERFLQERNPRMQEERVVNRVGGITAQEQDLHPGDRRDHLVVRLLPPFLRHDDIEHDHRYGFVFLRQQDRFVSPASRPPGFNDPCGGGGVHLGEIYPERRPPSRLAVHVDEPVVLLDDPVNDGKSQACSLVRPLRREERLEDALPGLLVHSHPRVAHRKHRVPARLHVRILLQVSFLQRYDGGFDGKLPPLRHGVTGVETEVHRDLLDLSTIRADHHRPLRGDGLDLDVRSCDLPDEFHEAGHYLVLAEDPELHVLDADPVPDGGEDRLRFGLLFLRSCSSRLDQVSRPLPFGDVHDVADDLDDPALFPYRLGRGAHPQPAARCGGERELQVVRFPFPDTSPASRYPTPNRRPCSGVPWNSAAPRPWPTPPRTFPLR